MRNLTNQNDYFVRVMLVDDEPEVTELLSYALRKEPYQVVTASSGISALELFTQEPADVVVTDIRMPGMDGLELSRRILEARPETQIIVITAHGDMNTAVEAMKLGASDFLQKPVHNLELKMSIANAVEKWKLRRELYLANYALREEQELLSITIRSIGEGLITTDTSGRITIINSLALEMTGWTEEEAKGEELHEVFSVVCSGSEETVGRPLYKILDHSDTDEIRCCSKLHSRNGSDPIEIAISVSPLLDTEGQPRGKVIIFRDITAEKVEERKARLAEAERQRMQAQIQRAQKMEAIGMMAGGVAHDLNNILSGILSYPELLLMDLGPDHKMRKPLETIRDAGQRAADIVADLLTVARGAAADKRSEDLNRLIEGYIHTPELRSRSIAKPEVEITTDLAPELLPVECSAVHIRKCLLNLIINAYEAISGPGTITISTENRYLDKPLRGYDNVRKGEYVVLSVRDTGEGIAEEDIEHIFEPFYTKKVMGRSGTGLGLAVVWNTMQDHNGYIDVSTSQDGTCFELYFQAARNPASEADQHEILSMPQGNGERILVVDDEQAQQDIACALLSRLGYQPEAVGSGEKAVEYMKEKGADLLLLDMIMEPGLNGRQTYEQIVAMHPGQRAIIASGFSETEEVRRAQQLGAGRFIRKPYTLALLAEAVNSELNRKPNNG